MLVRIFFADSITLVPTYKSVNVGGCVLELAALGKGFQASGYLPKGQPLACEGKGQARACVRKDHDQPAAHWANTRLPELSINANSSTQPPVFIGFYVGNLCIRFFVKKPYSLFPGFIHYGLVIFLEAVNVLVVKSDEFWVLKGVKFYEPP